MPCSSTLPFESTGGQVLAQSPLQAEVLAFLVSFWNR